MRQKLQVIWDVSDKESKLKQFIRFLRNRGARQSTIDDYLFRVKKYIEFCDDNKQSLELAQEYRNSLFDRGLSNSSVANYSYAIRSFHKMLGQDIKFQILNAPMKSLISSRLMMLIEYSMQYII